MASDFEIKYTVTPDENSIKSGAKRVSAAFKDVNIEVKADTNKAKTAIKDVVKNEKIKVDVDADMTKAKTKISKLENELKEVKLKLTADTAEIKANFNNIIKNLKEEFEQAGHKAGKSFGDKFKGGLSSIGNIAGGIGLANLATNILGFVKNAGTAAIELDKQVKNIGTLGVANFEEFSQKALELSKTVPDSAANIAGAVYEAVSAGITGSNDDIMNFVAVASKSAVAGMTDTATSVSGLTSVLNAYKRPVTDAAAVSNELFAGVKLGKITFEEFTNSLGEVVPTAAALGVGFDEVSASIATITAQGVGAPQAFTKLNQLMIEVQKPGAGLAKVMKGVTVEIGGVVQTLSGSNISAAIKQQGLTKTLQDIEQSATKMGLSLTQAFSSSEAGAAALLLTGKNADYANKMLSQTREEIKKGAAEQAFNIANQSIEVQLKLLQNNLQAALQPVFANILPLVGELAKQISNIFSNPEIQKAFQAISMIINDLLTTVLPPLMDILAPLLSNLLTAISPIISELSKIIAQILPSLLEILKPVIAILPQLGDIIAQLLVSLQPLIAVLTKDLMGILSELLKQTLPLLMNLLQALIPIITPLIELFSVFIKIGLYPIQKIVELLTPLLNGLSDAISGVIKPLESAGAVVSDFIDSINPFSESVDEATAAQKRLEDQTTNTAIALIKQLEAQVKLAALVGTGEIAKSLFGIDLDLLKLPKNTENIPSPIEKNSGGGNKEIKFKFKPINKGQFALNLLESKNNLLDYKPTIELGIKIKEGSPIFGIGLDEEFTKQYNNITPIFQDLTDKLNALFVPTSETKNQLKEAETNYKRDAALLKKQLLEKKISLEDFQKQSEELENNRASTTEAINEKIGNSFDKLAQAIGISMDTIEQYLSGQFVDALKTAQKEFVIFTKDNETGLAKIEFNFAALGDAATLALGTAAAAMGEALATGENAGQAFLVSLLDMVQKAILTYIPLIYSSFISWLGPLFGIPAATAAIALVSGGLSVAKGAIGAEDGVVGINSNYNKKRGVTDTIPLWVAPEETIFSAQKTRKNRELFEAIQNDKIDSWVNKNYARPETYERSNYSVNVHGELIKTNRALLNAINNGIEVRANNFNNIKIVDKTEFGVKVMNFR